MLATDPTDLTHDSTSVPSMRGRRPKNDAIARRDRFINQQLADLANEGEKHRLRVVKPAPAAFGGELAHAIAQRFEIRHQPSMTRAAGRARA